MTAAQDEVKDTWDRFFVHWFAVAMGVFFHSLLPVIVTWTNPNTPVQFERWWAWVLYSFIIATLGGAINSNLPYKPREVLKSVRIGFAIDAAAVIARSGGVHP